jgi:Trp operon repressor
MDQESSRPLTDGPLSEIELAEVSRKIQQAWKVRTLAGLDPQLSGLKRQRWKQYVDLLYSAHSSGEFVDYGAALLAQWEHEDETVRLPREHCENRLEQRTIAAMFWRSVADTADNNLDSQIALQRLRELFDRKVLPDLKREGLIK